MLKRKEMCSDWLRDTYPGLNVDAGISEAGIQSDVLNLAQETEQRVHLVSGGLRMRLIIAGF